MSDLADLERAAHAAVDAFFDALRGPESPPRPPAEQLGAIGGPVFRGVLGVLAERGTATQAELAEALGRAESGIGGAVGLAARQLGGGSLRAGYDALRRLGLTWDDEVGAWTLVSDGRDAAGAEA